MESIIINGLLLFLIIYSIVAAVYGIVKMQSCDFPKEVPYKDKIHWPGTLLFTFLMGPIFWFIAVIAFILSWAGRILD